MGKENKSILSIGAGVVAGIMASDTLIESLGDDSPSETAIGLVGGGIVGSSVSNIVDEVEDILGVNDWF